MCDTIGTTLHLAGFAIRQIYVTLCVGTLAKTGGLSVASTKELANYRFDVRDQKQFEEDIKRWHTTENWIADVLQKMLTVAFNRSVEVRPNGCAMDGRYLEDNEVTTEPDYSLHVEGWRKVVPLEIKSADGLLQTFHIKVEQIESYLRQDPRMLILMVRGTGTKRPEFTVLRPEDFLNHSFEQLPFATWGGKLCYRLYAYQFRWEPFVLMKYYRRGFFSDPWIKEPNSRQQTKAI